MTKNAYNLNTMVENEKHEQNETLEYSDVDLEIFELELESGLNYRQRRQSDWNDNYTLYRDKVITNRLTQRQTINIPLMKYGLNTLLKDVDDLPILYFDNVDNDEQAEIFYNEYWKEISKQNKIEIRDIIDKKQAFLYGRTFKKLNIVDGKPKIEIVDPQDVVVHRFVDPADLDSAPCLIQTGIYKTLRSILENDDFDKEERERLELYFNQDDTVVEKDTTWEAALDKSKRLSDMGVPDVITPVIGETYIELNEMYRYEDHETKGNIIWRYVIAATDNGNFKLHKAPLCDVIGKTVDNFWYNHFPINSWAVDPEATDFWSDGVADILRNTNKVLNAWISQLVENRTLRNFGMTFYDSSDAEFHPQTFTPMPWGFYPVPGKPQDVMQPVQIPDLSESLDEISFLINIAEKATAATSANSGAIEQGSVTLGEVELALANAKERVQSVQKFYTEAWRDFGLKYVKLLEAAPEQLDNVIITKKGRLGKKVYRREVSANNWKTKSGYAVDIRTQTDKQQEDIEKVQKLRILRQELPDNVPLTEIYNKKLMEFAGLSADEITQVEEYENREPVQTEEAGLTDSILGLRDRAERVLANEQV